MAVTQHSAPKKVGIFGGTFDPPHLGHVRICEASAQLLSLDELVVVVANDPWQKSADVQASASDRLTMARAAFGPIEKVSVSDIEIVRGGHSYMIDTVEALAATDRELFLILGADAANTLPTWNRYTDLARLVTVAIVGRAGELSHIDTSFRSVTVDIERFDCSSSEIRARVANGSEIDSLVPPAVILEIAQRHLYTSA